MKLNRRGFLKLFGLTAIAHVLPVEALEIAAPEIAPVTVAGSIFNHSISASVLDEFMEQAAWDNFFVTTAFQSCLRSKGGLDPFDPFLGK